MPAQLSPADYDVRQQVWRALPEASPVDVPRLTIATFNVWFGQAHFDARCDATLRLLRECDADVICLQEVTARFLARLMLEPWVREGYAVSDSTGDSVYPYGVLLLSRLPVSSWKLHPLPSAMDRHLLTAVVLANGSETVVGTVHLESLLPSAPVRAAQLRIIFSLLSGFPHALLMGDFNFCSSWDENRSLEPAYRDLWLELHPADPGFTQDPTRNWMREALGADLAPVRFDRILLRTVAPAWVPESIRLIGTEAISPLMPEVFPSDHFGLCTTLRRSVAPRTLAAQHPTLDPAPNVRAGYWVPSQGPRLNAYPLGCHSRGQNAAAKAH